MPAPIAKGIIIGATIIVAAGIALYENPHVRQWVDQSRRKIAIVLGACDDSIDEKTQHEPHAHRGANADEEWRRHQEDMIRRRRSEIIRKAREDGIAVDLDELARTGKETSEKAVPRPHARKGSSFDDLVGADGRLKPEEHSEKSQAVTTSTDVKDGTSNIRQRGRRDDSAHQSIEERTQDLLDHDLIGATQDDISRTVSPQPMQSPPQLLDLATSSSAEEPFHSFLGSSPARSRASSFASPGTLTPTSDDDGFSTAASVVGTQASDIGLMSPSLHSVQNDDAMSEAFSEITGGQSTPGSWTDVGSESGSEFNFQHSS